MTKIYIASPLGFSESGRFFLYEKIVPLMEGLNLTCIDPWKLTPEHLIEKVNSIEDTVERKNEWTKLNRIIAENNKNGIIESEGILAILDGTDVDSGTASEIGYGAALNKKICGYRSDFRRAGDNDGATVNLQVEYFILKSGGLIVTDLHKLESELKRLFTA